MKLSLLVLVCLLLGVSYCETVKETKGQMKFLVLTEECYDTFIVKNIFTDSECIKTTISKLVGLSIVGFATILKVPQIMKILKSSSTDGLVFTGFFTELIMYTLTVGYNLNVGNSFGLYGENVFIAVQNIIILLMFFKYDKITSRVQMTLLLIIYAAGAVPTLLQIIPVEIYNYSMYINMGLVALARLPQIWSNFKNSSTGQLAAVSVFLSFAGAAARLMTQLKESPDDVLSLGLTLESVVLNGIVFFQILMYWNSGSKKVDDKKKKQ